MPQQLQFISLLIVLVVIASLIETVIPGYTDNRRRRQHAFPNLALMFLTFTMNALLNIGALFFAEYISVNQHALIKLEAPFWLLALASIAILDFFAYAAHRLMHVIPWLWRVHRVHHADLLVDVTTSYRQHPLEGFWRFLFTIIPAWALGVPPEIIALYKLTSAVFAIIEHINVELWAPLDNAISRLFVTPNMHKIHHSSDEPETNSNYGNIISIYDRLLGTFKPQRKLSAIDYGLDGFADPETQRLSGLLSLPFRRDGRRPPSHIDVT